MAETNATGMTQATTNRSIEETEKKQKARIELLEKKVRAKDQLFEDALASTVGSSAENKTVTSELKRRFLKLRAKHEEAEAEI